MKRLKLTISTIMVILLLNHLHLMYMYGLQTYFIKQALYFFKYSRDIIMCLNSFSVEGSILYGEAK